MIDGMMSCANKSVDLVSMLEDIQATQLDLGKASIARHNLLKSKISPCLGEPQPMISLTTAEP
jgi:hypothetical protein